MKIREEICVTCGSVTIVQVYPLNKRATAEIVLRCEGCARRKAEREKTAKAQEKPVAG